MSENFFKKINRGTCEPIYSLKAGETAVITAKESNNGVFGFFEINDKNIEQGCSITVSANGIPCKAFYHPYRFAASKDVLVARLKRQYDTISFNKFICKEITKNSWKFSYDRKCTLKKFLKDVKIRVPMSGGEIDFNLIEKSTCHIHYPFPSPLK